MHLRRNVDKVCAGRGPLPPVRAQSVLNSNKEIAASACILLCLITSLPYLPDAPEHSSCEEIKLIINGRTLT